MSIHTRVAQSKFESPAQEAMVSLVVSAAQVMQALEDACAAHGVTHDQYNVLRILRGAGPAGHPRYAIADRLMSRAPDVTRLLDRLSRDGLVERTRSESDRRLSISRITADGRSLLGRLDPDVLRVHERFASGMSDRELRDLSRLCARIVSPG